MARQPGTNYCFFSGSYGSSNTYETTVAKLGLVKNSGINEAQMQTNNKAGLVEIFHTGDQIDQSAPGGSTEEKEEPEEEKIGKWGKIRD